MVAVLEKPDLKPIATYRHGGKRKKWFRQEWHEAELRKRYDSRAETIRELTVLFNVPDWVVKKWAQELGLARTKEKPWSEAEVAYLEQWLHRRNITVIARHLGRTTTAAALKAKRLGLNKSNEGYTERQCAIGFGVDESTVGRWIRGGKLKAALRGTNRTEAQGGDMVLITDDNIKAFVRRCPTEFDLRKVDQLWFLGIILGDFGQ